MTNFSDAELINLKSSAEREISEYLSKKEKNAKLLPHIKSKNFSQWNDPTINEKIYADLSIIVTMISESIPNAADIILTGGFSRGEGSVLYEESGVQPVNDYDIIITSEESLDHKLMRSLSAKIANTVGIRLIDLINIPLKNLKSLPFTMFNYDLKYGGEVIYGDARILDEIPNMDSSKMPLPEGKVLLFNRLICLMECFNYDFLRRSPSNEEKFFLVNQCNKAILACCDAHLILLGKYHHSYREKNKRFQSSVFSDMILQDSVNRAINFKLTPTKRIDFNVVDYWFTVKKIYLDTLLFYLNHTFIVSEKFSDFIDFGEFYSGYSLNCKKSNLELAEIFTLLSINTKGIDLDYLKIAKEHIMTISDQNLVEPDWERIRKECTRLWFELNH
jgi:hypothetical protein